jgi:hypothetical protein
MDPATEREHLRKADANIAAARKRIERQGVLVARLQDRDHDATTAKELLQTMRETLAAMEQHRQQILRELAC